MEQRGEDIKGNSIKVWGFFAGSPRKKEHLKVPPYMTTYDPMCKKPPVNFLFYPAD